MNTNVLESILHTDPATRKIQTGVFPSNKKPETVRYPSAFVFNFDTASRSGTHWVAVYFTGNKVGYYFDSYGDGPYIRKIDKFVHDNADRYEIFPVSVQSLDTDVCGHYCIYFLTAMAKSVKFDDIIGLFGSYPEGTFDDIIRCYIEQKYSEIVPASIVCGQRCIKKACVCRLFDHSSTESGT